MPTVAELAREELSRRYSLQGRTQVAPRVQTMRNEPSVRSALSNLMRDAVDATGLTGGYRQGLLNAAGDIGTAVDFAPVVGDALAIEDAAQSYGQGDLVGAGINMMGVVPVVGDVAAKAAKSALRGLDMSQGARMQRAADQGYVGGIYHGSTHDISEFDLDPMNPESHFGKGVYTTTSPEDASLNYAGEGPDLSNRIQQRAERLESAEDLPPNEAMQRARQELKGSNEGVVYPLMGRTTKPFDISSEGDTFLEYRQRELDPEDYLDEADGDMDLAIELAQDDSYNFEPEGELVDFLDALQRNPSLSAEDFATLQQNILEEAYDGGISASRLDEIFRGSDIYPEDEMGNLVGNDVFRQAIKDTGYDTIIHDANIFRGMEATDGAQHRIFLNPNQLRSPSADFDPAKMDSADLLSSVPTSSLRDIA